MTETTVLAPIEATDEQIKSWLNAWATNTGYQENVSAEEYEAMDAEDREAVEDEEHFGQFGGYNGMDSLSELIDVASALSEQVTGRLCLSPIGTVESGIDAFMVEAHVEDSIYLSKFMDWKYITDDRSAARGWPSALGYARALIGEYNTLARYAVSKGLGQ